MSHDLIELDQLMPLAENDSGSRLYAVVDSCIHPDVPDFVQGLQANARSLFSGNAGRDFGSVAPYLIAVDPIALEWIVTNLWSMPWGILVSAKSDLEQMRRHFRRFLMVGGPRDKELYFRFYDPRVMQSFIESAPLPMIARFTEPIESLWVITEDQEIVRLKPPQRIAEETQNLTNGKLRFSEANLRAFALASKWRFRERLIKHLSAKIAEQGQTIGSQYLSEQVDEGISRALHYEIKSQRLIARYIETACLGMGGFTEDRDPIPVRNILLDRRIDINQRLDRFEQFVKNKTSSIASGT